jgi:hypothetical protein
MAATLGMTDFSAVFLTAEQLCDLLDRKSEIMKNIPRRSPPRAPPEPAATVGNELPLERLFAVDSGVL